MKELSIEEKAKRYDEAIKKAEPLYKAAEPMSGCNVIIETIFPELKESEDERVRKAIINVFGSHKDYEVFFGVSVTDILAWLEKQGEQKPVELPKGEDYGIDGLYAAIDILKKTLGKVDGYQTDDGILEHKCAITAVKKLYNQKPAWWSEEDETMLERVIKFIPQCMTAHGYNEYINWLKSLKERVQPEQEWSEEDEKCIRLSTDIIDSALRAGFCVQLDRDRCVDWLKSLRPQNTWKPSDEWIEILDMVLTNESMDDNIARILRELREQLKKLREE